VTEVGGRDADTTTDRGLLVRCCGARVSRAGRPWRTVGHPAGGTPAPQRRQNP